MKAASKIIKAAFLFLISWYAGVSISASSSEDLSY